MAFTKAEEVKQIAAKNVHEMAKNLHETDQLLDKTDNIKDMAKQFEKNADEMEKIQRRNNWWLCSKPCLIIFGSIGLVVLILFLILYFSV